MEDSIEYKSPSDLLLVYQSTTTATASFTMDYFQEMIEGPNNALYFYQKHVSNNEDDGRRGAVARASSTHQPRDKILDVDHLDTQIYVSKYETKFMFSIAKLDLGMTKTQQEELKLALLNQRLVYK